LVGDAVKQARRLLGTSAPILVRMDSAYYGRDAIHAAITSGGVHVSVTVRAVLTTQPETGATPGTRTWHTLKRSGFHAVFKVAALRG
jgi:hypothetical protein